jgi:hypothetical protein
MGFFQWLGNGVSAVNKFFDSLYMRLPYNVRGLIWGFGIFTTVLLAMAAWPGNFLNEYVDKLLEWIGDLLNPWGK